MNAARTVIIDLDLPQTPTRSYNLWLSLGLLSGHLTAVVSVNRCVIASASGTGELTESASLGHALQIGTARFKLLPEEVEPVRVFLAKFPSPATPSHAADHEAADATDLPVSGEGGTTSRPVCTGRDALESEASILAYALIHGECY